MPLQAGQRFDYWTDIPEESRPEQALATLSTLPGGQGTRHSARTAKDGTRWCLTCYMTLQVDGRDALCEECKRMRDSMRRTERRRLAQNTTIAVPQTAIEQLAKLTQDLDRAIGQVLVAVETGRPIDAPALKLTRLTKYISALVGDEFTTRLPPRPRR